MSPTLVTAVAFLWLGCTDINQIEKAENKSVKQIEILQEQSAGKIPCPSEKIEITGYKVDKSDGSEYWTAFGCDGNTYNCVRSNKDDQDVNCKQVDPDLIN
jgi:hypothetical protein